MEEDKALDPMNVRFLGSVAIMPRVDRLADLIEQLRFRSRREWLNVSLEIQPAFNYGKRAVYGFVCICCFHYDGPPSVIRRTVVIEFLAILSTIAVRFFGRTAPADPASSARTCRSNARNGGRYRR